MANRNVELLAVGSGPSNLAVAVALEELAPGLARDSLLIERDEEVTWQRGMMVPGATSQVSFLKDLVTLRNPRSRFSFLNYLHDVGRLEQFINLGSPVPYRAEVADYLRWAAKSLSHVSLELGSECTAIEPVREDGVVTGFLTRTSAGDTIRSRYLVLGTGRDARIPEPLLELKPERVIHSTQYLSRISLLDKDKPHRVVVIGAGQSAGELFLTVRSDLPQCRPTMLMRAIGPAGCESSKFINELFYTGAVDEFHAARPAARLQILQEMHHTNYAGMSASTLDTLYHEIYLDKLSGRNQLSMVTAHDITAAREEGGEAVLELTDWRTGEVQELRADVVLCGTGFRADAPWLMRSVADGLGVSEIAVTRDYRLVVHEPCTAAVYLQGVNEATHGLSDSLLSVMAARAGDIVRDIFAHRAETLSGTAQTALVS